MDVIAKTRFVRLAPSRALDMAHALQGLPVPKALEIVSFSERKAAFYLGKTLKSAIANAENNHQLSAENLYVKEAAVDPGPVMKRYWPRSRGSASPVLKRTSHVRITLTDEKPRRKK
jgi:large subunit ribosomal protein L22